MENNITKNLTTRPAHLLAYYLICAMRARYYLTGEALAAALYTLSYDLGYTASFQWATAPTATQEEVARAEANCTPYRNLATELIIEYRKLWGGEPRKALARDVFDDTKLHAGFRALLADPDLYAKVFGCSVAAALYRVITPEEAASHEESARARALRDRIRYGVQVAPY